MGNAALDLQSNQEFPKVHLTLVKDGAPGQTSNSLLFIALVLITLQVLDGVLTGIGMEFYGISHEGNPILRNLMEYVGYANALILTKGLAIVIICFLVKMGERVSWLEHAMKGVALLYIGAAIIPWSFILAGSAFF